MIKTKDYPNGVKTTVVSTKSIAESDQAFIFEAIDKYFDGEIPQKRIQVELNISASEMRAYYLQGNDVPNIARYDLFGVKHTKAILRYQEGRIYSAVIKEYV